MGGAQFSATLNSNKYSGLLLEGACLSWDSHRLDIPFLLPHCLTLKEADQREPGSSKNLDTSGCFVFGFGFFEMLSLVLLLSPLETFEGIFRLSERGQRTDR